MELQLGNAYTACQRYSTAHVDVVSSLERVSKWNCNTWWQCYKAFFGGNLDFPPPPQKT